MKGYIAVKKFSYNGKDFTEYILDELNPLYGITDNKWMIGYKKKNVKVFRTKKEAKQAINDCGGKFQIVKE